MGKTFLVAVDGSLQGWKAMDLAITLAKASDAELVLVHVVPREPVPKGIEKWAEMEGVSAEEARARIRTGRTLGDNITHEAETRAKDAGLDRILRGAGMLTRDSRMIERKKYGHKKARKSFQFSKR